MGALLIMLVAFGGYLLMYNLYGKYIGNKIFKLDDSNPVPAVEFEDGTDFVPTKKEIIFGHHFTSIAGTGPIVGPAIAIIWGWVPAMLWVFIGSIIMGAVHDFGSLIISMRNKGKSISEFTAMYVSSRTRFLIFFVIFIELWIIISIFGLVMAVLFKMFPGAVWPVWLEIPIAMYVGYAVYKKGANVTTWSIIGVVTMYITVILGAWIPFSMPSFFGISPIGIWSIVLLIYAYFASVLPVTALLQPRDYLNSHQLVIAMGLMILGVIFAAFGGNLEIVAPAVQAHPKDAPSVWPFLFVTIACGSISGWHSLVASGTSARQVRRETDSLFVGYGSMLMEAALATLVIISVSAGIGMAYTLKDGTVLHGVEAWTHHYSSWAAAKGLASKVGAFVIGAANMIETLGIPHKVATVIMGVFVASFAGTTLDTATRIERYILAETFPKQMSNRFVATAVVIVLALFLIFSTGANGKGALVLWPLFGATNQTLAGLALIIITVFLKTRGGAKWILTAIPAAFMLTVSFWALWINEVNFINKGNYLLIFLNGLIMLSVVWITIEGIIRIMNIEELDVDEKTGAVRVTN